MSRGVPTVSAVAPSSRAVSCAPAVESPVQPIECCSAFQVRVHLHSVEIWKEVSALSAKIDEQAKTIQSTKASMEKFALQRVADIQETMVVIKEQSTILRKLCRGLQQMASDESQALNLADIRLVRVAVAEQEPKAPKKRARIEEEEEGEILTVQEAPRGQ